MRINEERISSNYGIAAYQAKAGTQTGPEDDMVGWPQELCREILLASPWPMFVMDCEQFRIVEVNEAAIQKYGLSRETFLEEGIERMIPPEYRDELRLTLSAGMEGVSREFQTEHLLGNTRIPVEVFSFPIRWQDRPARFSMVRYPLQLESPRPARLVGRANRREMDAAPSGSLAHDFNNLLTVILAVAEQMQDGEGDPELQAQLISRTVRNAQELASHRLMQGHQQQSRREQIQLNRVLEEQSDALRALLGRDVVLEMHLDENLWSVFADESQWRESILNLAVNARDAMPEGGTFYISTRRALLAGDDAELGLPHGRYIHVVVRDTGIGMAEETRAHAFEPYFSTKSRSRNSGLGLASVQSVVQQSGGGIRLTSAPGQGARFDIFIPAPESAGVDNPGGFILLVEDAEELRKLIQDFLIARGYEVISCGTADSAMQWARTVSRPLNLVITDLLLPDVSGEILAEQIRLRHPEARVVLMSGQQAALIHGPATEYAVYLQKPFSLHQLARTVSELLNVRA
ncbi:ATP-binding protein [Silvibacterium sp.]|uniref:hybrid sensor histidine kinase/response regulator n=1 Tax=Silvibacterium sp. TaxID=1964179 RepID=UPI0039E45664